MKIITPYIYSNNEGGPRATRVYIVALLSLCPRDGDGINRTESRGLTSKIFVRSMLGDGDGDGDGEVRGHSHLERQRNAAIP